MRGPFTQPATHDLNAAVAGSDVAVQYQKLVATGTLTEEEFWLSDTVSKMLGRDGLSLGTKQQQGISNKLPDVMKCLVHINQGQAKLQVGLGHSS
jgi:hypothetical protein